MITDDYKLHEVLQYLPVSDCDYLEWTEVGMALKTEGYPCSVWDDWSRADTRYHAGECEKKWKSFHRSDVRAGSIIQMAMDHGWKPEQKKKDWDNNIPLDWESEIGGGAAAERRKALVDQNWIQETEVPPPPTPWDPVDQIKRYLLALFDSSEYVGISTETYPTPEGNKPTRGRYNQTQGDILAALAKYGDDIGAAIGDYKKETGAWIRFNPLDGKGVQDTNVTAFRYALVESDTIPIPKQYAIYKELHLPIRILVHSGGKSLHAIVSIDAHSYDEYRKRVDYLYKVCKESGLDVDRVNRNPSRLSRLPGIIRGDNKQYIVGENLGCPTWDDWVDYVEGANDDLPDFECFGDLVELPPLKPELISGILREGHKMLISGPSKAGKSFLLMELAVDLAEGLPWLGHPCKQSKVLYLNLEIDRPSFLDRLQNIYNALGIIEKSRNLEIWHLRGHSVPLDKLVPKLVRRAHERGFNCIIIDPAYKVIIGDENSAEQMARFCNLFDQITRQLGCSVIYCHHHSKGAQGQKKAMDRASGSGVFARDPDAIMDLIQLIVKQDRRASIITAKKDATVTAALNRRDPSIVGNKKLDLIEKQQLAREKLPRDEMAKLNSRLGEIDQQYERATAWRIESTLREFPPADDMYCWFRFPLHEIDTSNTLNEFRAEGEKGTTAGARAEKKDTDLDEKREKFIQGILSSNAGEPPTLEQLANYVGFVEKTVKKYINNEFKDIMWYDKNDKKVKLKDANGNGKDT